jgi:transposase InsO family protein
VLCAAAHNTYLRTWAGFTYVAFIVDVFAQMIVGWHAATDKRTELVLVPLRMALWDRDRHGHRVGSDQLAHHSDTEYVTAGDPGLVDPHSDGRDRMLVPGCSRAS